MRIHPNWMKKSKRERMRTGEKKKQDVNLHKICILQCKRKGTSSTPKLYHVQLHFSGIFVTEIYKLSTIFTTLNTIACSQTNAIIFSLAAREFSLSLECSNEKKNTKWLVNYLFLKTILNSVRLLPKRLRHFIFDFVNICIVISSLGQLTSSPNSNMYCFHFTADEIYLNSRTFQWPHELEQVLELSGSRLNVVRENLEVALK